MEKILALLKTKAAIIGISSALGVAGVGGATVAVIHLMSDEDKTEQVISLDGETIIESEEGISASTKQESSAKEDKTEESVTGTEEATVATESGTNEDKPVREKLNPPSKPEVELGDIITKDPETGIIVDAETGMPIILASQAPSVTPSEEPGSTTSPSEAPQTTPSESPSTSPSVNPSKGPIVLPFVSIEDSMKVKEKNKNK